MYIKIRYGGWPNISDIIKIPLFFLGLLHDDDDVQIIIIIKRSYIAHNT